MRGDTREFGRERECGAVGDMRERREGRRSRKEREREREGREGKESGRQTEVQKFISQVQSYHDYRVIITAYCTYINVTQNMNIPNITTDATINLHTLSQTACRY